MKKHWVDISIVLVVLAMALYFANEYLWKPRQEESVRVQLADALLHHWEAEEPAIVYPTTPLSKPESLPIAETVAEEEPSPPTSVVVETNPIDFESAVGLLRVSAWGEDYAAVIVEGVSEADIKNAVGHFPDSALPGEIGNCALAAHRTAAGGLFHNLHKLAAGDRVVVETKTHLYVYELYGQMETVPNDAWEEVAPVPHDMEAEATMAYITLQGCQMNREGSHRVIWHGVLVEVGKK